MYKWSKEDEERKEKFKKMLNKYEDKLEVIKLQLIIYQ